MNNSKPEKTAATPFLLEEEADLLENKIDSGSSFEEIFNSMWKKEEWIDIVSENAKQGCEVNVLKNLFHSLSRPLLRSVLMKRVAYDFYHLDSGEWEGLHKDTDAGAYVTSIHIQNRRGKFLCLTELKEVIEHMKAYADAVDAYMDDQLEDIYTPYEDELPRTRVLLDKAMHIDDQYSTYTYVPGDKHPKPKFGGAGSKNIKLCKEMLQRWVSLHEGDASTFWKQAPLMVGNSGSKVSRMLSHDPLAGGLEGTPKVWALALSIIKSMGLSPLVVTVPLFTCWERRQVNPAEVLGTILARSMVSSYGFNVKQPGTWIGSVDQTVLDDAKRRVFGSENSHFKRNLLLTHKGFKDVLDARRELENKKKELQEAIKDIERKAEVLRIEKAAEKQARLDLYHQVLRDSPRLEMVTRDLTDISDLLSDLTKRLGR